jgi:hypothetical protein
MVTKIRKKIRTLADLGNGTDSMIAHINPREAALLKAHGGSGRTNPKTGIREFDDGGFGGGGGGDGGDGGGDGFGGGDYGGYGGGGYGDGSDGYGDFGGNGSVDYGVDPTAGGDFGGESTSNEGIGGDGDANYSLEGYSYGDPSYSVNSPVNASMDALNGSEDSFLAKLAKRAVLSRLGPVGAVAGTMASATQSPQAATSNWGSTLGGMLGSMAAGPLGGVVGGFLGGKAGAGLGNVGDASASGNSAQGHGGDFLGGIASLYNYNRAQNDLKQQSNSLSGMYGQDSPYAQTMRQQLERRDAAAGRRSQYGPREVELQAQLARLASGNANSIYQINQQRTQNRAQGLAQLLNAGKSSGAFDWAQKGLGGLFNDPGMSVSIPQTSNTLNSLFGNEGYGDW